MGRFVHVHRCRLSPWAPDGSSCLTDPWGRSLLAASAGVALVAQTLFTLGYWFT